MKNSADVDGASLIDTNVWFSHLRPCHLDDRDAILQATLDIEMSLTGRSDMFQLNIFFAEASKELRNAVKLFESGMFDAAFYSVRSAVELARVVAYFSGDDDPASSELYETWKKGGWFPLDGKIRKNLSEDCAPFQEVKDALPKFFDERNNALHRANKYIHRQGFHTFYSLIQRPETRYVGYLHVMRDEFHSFIMGAVTEIILLRLSVDPFPILLRDPDVMYKIQYISLTKPLSDTVVDLFLTPKIIDSYRSTSFYSQLAEEFSGNEPFSKAAYDLFNFGIYHHADHDKIMQQFNLLEKSDRIVVRIFECVADVLCIDKVHGLKMYTTESFNFNKGFSISYGDLGTDPEQPGIVNRPCPQGYETHIHIDGDIYVLVHAHPLSDDSMRSLERLKSDIEADS
ncbi:MAG: hypothetical protein LKI78_02150 [Bifidobacterium tibiigranuli]|jgi:hypothetical protein|uniref:hypothetical protein n=1 Tax=Bifidobacterium TaxID=1678 RepID=UPI00235225C2|nr:hypothetical protein [Bifidobacterium tibiigranuli]MCH3975543.1 hypothetical protein [Bifidobacterium tibiigranuli]MCI1833624.1 hypothetical protein [Bifidobacterium tibiigranuli]